MGISYGQESGDLASEVQLTGAGTEPRSIHGQAYKRCIFHLSQFNDNC